MNKVKRCVSRKIVRSVFRPTIDETIAITTSLAAITLRDSVAKWSGRREEEKRIYAGNRSKLICTYYICTLHVHTRANTPYVGSFVAL